MALIPYKSHENSPNRGRSSSCSSPVRKQIVYREIYSIGDNTLVRSYSCNHVFDRDVSGQTIQTTHIEVSSFLTPEKMKSTCMDKETQENPKEIEQTPQLPAKKGSSKKKLKMDCTKQTNTKPRYCSWKKSVSIFILPLISSYILYYYIINRECDYIWDVEGTVHELKENIFGQDDAIARISSVLIRSNASNDFLTMVFTGGVGVGKTYASSIISNNFPWSSNRMLTHSESFDLQIQNTFKSSLSKCGCNLVIVDDLSFKNLNDVMRLVAYLNNKRQNNENILIILIFQVHSENERHDIINRFKESYITFYHIPFKNLSRDVVRECYLAEIRRQQIEIPVSELNKLIEDKMEHVEIVKGPVGCKGVAEDVSPYSKKNLI